MARIILHVGTHKTGTTGLQRSLFEQRDHLEESGISYDPWPGVLWSLKYAHHGLVHRLARFDAEDQKVLADYRLRLEQALAKGQDVIISAEPFYRQVVVGVPKDAEADRVRFLDRVVEYFEGLPVVVSICFRRPDRMAESLFKEQAVSTSNRVDFVPWLDKLSPRFDYSARLAEFEQRFDSVKVWCFEDALSKGLISTFLQTHGLQVSNLENAKADRKSISSRAALWLLKAKQSDEDMSISERRIRWYYAASAHAHPALADRRGESFWPDVETRGRFLHTALGDFRHADYWSQPDDTPSHVEWATEQQSEVEAHFEHWAQSHTVLLQMRKAAKLAPYDSDDAIPGAMRLKYLPERIRARLFGSKSNWRE